MGQSNLYFRDGEVYLFILAIVTFLASPFVKGEGMWLVTRHAISKKAVHTCKTENDKAIYSPKMKLFLLVLATFLASSFVHGIKKCVKIDACRCSTDEGEINLWSLAGDGENGDSPR